MARVPATEACRVPIGKALSSSGGRFHVKHRVPVIQLASNPEGSGLNNLPQASSELLSNLCDSAGLRVTEAHQSVLLAYLAALIRMNERLNLTRIVECNDAIRMHIVDSLMCLPEILKAPDGELCDIGTGGGLPGVPLCVVSGRPGALLDSVGKKAGALNEILAELHLEESIKAVPARSEEHAKTHRGGYAVVTARAVSSLPALIEMAAPLLSSRGILVALKGAPSAEEVRRGMVVAKMVGLQQCDVRYTLLPGGDERRTVVSYQKIGRSSLRLPRRPGQAHNTPLA